MNNKFPKIVKLLISICIAIISLHIIPSNCAKANSLIPTISFEPSKGRDANGSKSDHALEGEWLFFEEKLYLQKDLSDSVLNGGKVVSIPGEFKNHMSGEKTNSFGTYVVDVSVPNSFIGKKMAIHVPYEYSAYALYVNDDLIASNGRVGTDIDSHEAEMAPKTGYFTPQNNTFLLIMQVSSFEHIRGGFENNIYLGEQSFIDQRVNQNMIFITFINGFIFIIGLFMVLFALYRRQEHLFLIFGFFSMFISARAFFTVPFYYTELFPNMSWSWGTRLEYILTITASMLFVLLMWKWHEREFSRRMMYFLVLLHLSLIFFTFFTKPLYFQTVFFKVFYIAIPVFFYYIYVVYKEIRNQNVHAKVNLLGIMFIFIAFLNDFAIGQGWYQSINLMLPAVALYIIIHVVTMSRDFAQTVFKIERQNKQLINLNDSNEQLTKQLKKEIKRKDDFLASTSHELRNPLHSIINIANSIIINKNQLIDKETIDDLKLQVTIGHHMSRTIDDLLDVTLLREKQIKLSKSSLQLISVINAVVDMLSVLNENKDVSIKIDIDEGLPYVAADKNRLIQILFNLLHNALKYTVVGTITITATAKGEFIRINIEDTGIGMDENLQSKVFMPYEQGMVDINQSKGGLGLGLSICKDLIELHGGEISVESTPDIGSVFSFTLPIANESNVDSLVDAEKELIDSSIATESVQSQGFYKMIDLIREKRTNRIKPRILIVDDDSVNLKVLYNVLSDDIYDIETVTNGEEALALIDKFEWDLVIADVMMSQMSGYLLTQKIRDTYSISELPIILLTARNNIEDIYSGFLAGANDYLIKPVDALELIVRVDALTDLRASIQERLRMEAAWLQAQIRPHFLLNTLNSIVSLSKVDKEEMVMLIEHFTNYLRGSFHFKNVDKLVLLEEELELVKSYLFIQQVRFGERLKVKMEIEKVKDVVIPPLVIQTLVENAVNHGVLQKIEGGTVTIAIKNRDSGVEISIKDDGVGMEEEIVNKLLIAHPDRKKGIGLINSEQRLQRLYGTGIQIESTVGEGSTFSFIIPVN